MLYGLQESDVEKIINVFKVNKNIDKAILFGSRAIKKFSEGSDIDIAIKGNNLKLNDILDISIAIDELYLPYKFDIVIYDRIKEPALLEHIDRVGIILFSKQNKETNK